MGIRFRAGSKVSKTVKTPRSFPLAIKHVRAMFQVADLRERVILTLATDLGLRIGDFLELKKTDLPSLDQEAPVSFDIMTNNPYFALRKLKLIFCHVAVKFKLVLL